MYEVKMEVRTKVFLHFSKLLLTSEAQDVRKNQLSKIRGQRLINPVALSTLELIGGSPVRTIKAQFTRYKAGGQECKVSKIWLIMSIETTSETLAWLRPFCPGDKDRPTISSSDVRQWSPWWKVTNKEALLQTDSDTDKPTQHIDPPISIWSSSSY